MLLFSLALLAVWGLRECNADAEFSLQPTPLSVGVEKMMKTEQERARSALETELFEIKDRAYDEDMEFIRQSRDVFKAATEQKLGIRIQHLEDGNPAVDLHNMITWLDLNDYKGAQERVLLEPDDVYSTFLDKITICREDAHDPIVLFAQGSVIIASKLSDEHLCLSLSLARFHNQVIAGIAGRFHFLFVQQRREMFDPYDPLHPDLSVMIGGGDDLIPIWLLRLESYNVSSSDTNREDIFTYHEFYLRNVKTVSEMRTHVRSLDYVLSPRAFEVLHLVSKHSMCGLAQAHQASYFPSVYTDVVPPMPGLREALSSSCHEVYRPASERVVSQLMGASRAELEQLASLFRNERHEPRVQKLLEFAQTLLVETAVGKVESVQETRCGVVSQIYCVLPTIQQPLNHTCCFSFSTDLAFMEIVGAESWIEISARREGEPRGAAELNSFLADLVAHLTYRRIEDIVRATVIGNSIKAKRLFVLKTAIPLYVQYAEAALAEARGFASRSEGDFVKRKRAAVCVTGMMRGADFIWQANRRFLRSLLPADFFVVTATDETSVKALLFQPTAVINIPDYAISLENFPPNFFEEWKYAGHRTHRFVHQMHKIKRCYDLVEAYSKHTGVEYDYIVRMRSDVVHHFEVPETLDPSVLHAQNKGYDLINFRPEEWFRDKFAMGSPAVMSKYMRWSWDHCYFSGILPHPGHSTERGGMPGSFLKACMDNQKVPVIEHEDWAVTLTRMNGTAPPHNFFESIVEHKMTFL